MQKRPSLRRSQRSIALMQFDITLVVLALLVIPILITHPISNLRLQGWWAPVGNVLDNFAVLLTALAPLVVLFIVLSPVRMWVLLAGLRNIRAHYYESLRSSSRTRRQQRIISRTKQARSRARRALRRLKPGELMSAPVGPLVLYVVYVAMFFLISTYAFGVAKSYASDYVTLSDFPGQLVIAAYPDLLVTTCYDPQSHTYAPGYTMQRPGIGAAVRFNFVTFPMTSPYVPRMPAPGGKCHTSSRP